MSDYAVILTFENYVHNTPIIFVPLVAHLFYAFWEFYPEEY